MRQLKSPVAASAGTASGNSRSGAANTFRAELAGGRRVEGMVFPGDLIWDDNPPPQAAGKLGQTRL